MPRKSTFGARLTALREAAGLTVAQLAERAGISRQHVYRLQADQDSVSWAVVLQLCNALGCTPNDFLPSRPRA